MKRCGDDDPADSADQRPCDLMMSLLCAAGQLCGMPDTPIDIKPTHEKHDQSPNAPDEAKQNCENCRKPIHGGLCGMQLIEFLPSMEDITKLHPQANLTNGIALICRLCINKLKRTATKSSDHPK